MSKLLPKGKSKPVLRDVNVYTYFQALYMSFYSRLLYIDVKHRWRGFGALYLLLLCAFLCVPWSATIIVKQYHYYNTVIEPSISQLPKIEIKKGDFVFDKKMPYVINDKMDKKPRIIIDTSGTIKTLDDGKYPDVFMLLTKTSIVTRIGTMPQTTQDLEKNLNGVMTPKEFMSLADKAKLLFAVTLYPTMVLSIFSGIFMVLLIYAFLAMFFSKMLYNYDLNYIESIRLCCVAVTPMTLILYVLYESGWHSQKLGLLLFCTLGFYYFYGLRANKRAAKGLAIT